MSYVPFVVSLVPFVVSYVPFMVSLSNQARRASKAYLLSIGIEFLKHLGHFFFAKNKGLTQR